MNIYYYADSTSRSPYNTGIQRVVRGLGREFQKHARVIFLEWSEVWDAPVVISPDNLKNLSTFNGPSSDLHDEESRMLEQFLRSIPRSSLPPLPPPPPTMRGKKRKPRNFSQRIQDQFRGTWKVLTGKKALIHPAPAPPPEAPDLGLRRVPLHWLETFRTEPGWIFCPELHYTRAGKGCISKLKAYARRHGYGFAGVFYDAIPWKLTDIYSPEASQDHRLYMEDFHGADRIFAISDYCRDDLLRLWHEWGLHGGEDRVISTLLPAEFATRPRCLEYRSAVGPEIRILTVGWLDPRKNHLTLLEAFSRLRSAHPRLPLRLTLVGPSAQKMDESLSHYWENDPAIEWKKSIPDDELAQLYNHCHFTVYPSIEEGFGMPILESVWYGKPCICRNAGSMLQLAQGGGCLAVETKSIDELATAIHRLATDHSLQESLGKECVSRPLKTWDEYGHEIISELRKTAGAPIPQGPRIHGAAT